MNCNDFTPPRVHNQMMMRIAVALCVSFAAVSAPQMDPASLRSDMLEHASSNNTEAALARAEELVDMARRLGDARDLGVTLTELGAMQFLNGDYRAAAWTLREALGLLKDYGLFDDDLVNVYAFLGLALQASGDHQEAVDMFARAEHVTHRGAGVSNQQQLPLMGAKTRSLLALGDDWLAEQVQSAAYDLVLEKSGPAALETVAATERFGNFLLSVGRYKRAITLYRGALDHVPDMSIESIPLLRGLANAYIAQRSEAGRSLALTRDIARILDAHKDQFSASDRALAWQDFADLLMSFSHESQAVEAYLWAWNIAETDPELLANWSARYASPQLVAPGPLKVLQDGAEAARSYEYNLMVDSDGRPRWVKLEDTNAGARTVRLTNAMVRSIRFRPVIVEGEPRKTDDYSLRVQRRPRPRAVAQVSFNSDILGPRPTGPNTTSVQ